MANVASAPATDSSQAADSDGLSCTAAATAPDSSSFSGEPGTNSHNSRSSTANSAVRKRMSGAAAAVDGAYEPSLNGERVGGRCGS